ncbi:hypothetical protein SAMN05216525_14715 [Bradyrhizobium sp. Gha]|nr:hypothetical protein SAMN05216525_14715 [Bradyrhizobium sp. Gha]
MFDAATTLFRFSMRSAEALRLARRARTSRPKILEAANRGEVCPEQLRQVGHHALSRAPTTWLRPHVAGHALGEPFLLPTRRFGESMPAAGQKP